MERSLQDTVNDEHSQGVAIRVHETFVFPHSNISTLLGTTLFRVSIGIVKRGKSGRGIIWGKNIPLAPALLSTSNFVGSYIREGPPMPCACAVTDST